jgi:methoxymalonate biosynthesis acyl carrier protein
MKSKLREFINENLVVFERDVEFADSDDIFERGFVDSIFALRLVEYVEKEFGIKVTNDDLDRRNFNSINNITDFVARKGAK